MTHECNQTNRLVSIEKSLIKNDKDNCLISQNVEMITDKLDKIEKKLDNFCNSATQLFVTRYEIEKIEKDQKQDIDKLKAGQDKFGRWLVGILFSIVMLLMSKIFMN